MPKPYKIPVEPNIYICIYISSQNMFYSLPLAKRNWQLDQWIESRLGWTEGSNPLALFTNAGTRAQLLEYAHLCMSGQKPSDREAMRMANLIAKGGLRGEAVAQCLLRATLQKASKVQRGLVHVHTAKTSGDQEIVYQLLRILGTAHQKLHASSRTLD